MIHNVLQLYSKIITEVDRIDNHAYNKNTGFADHLLYKQRFQMRIEDPQGVELWVTSGVCQLLQVSRV